MMNTPGTGLLRTTLPACVLLVALVLAAPPLFLGSAYIPWDATDLWLPWKNFITECLWNGTLPLWNPSIHHGFPQSGDPGTWYPVSWAFALKGRYDVSAMNAEYLFHLWWAGLGFYWLGRSLALPRLLAVALGTCYMCSGLMVGNAQHVGWVVSAAWLPWIIGLMGHLFRTCSIHHAAALALCMAMSLAGGYAGIFIIQAYLLLFLTIAGMVLRWRKGEAVAPWLRKLALAVVLFLPCAAAVLVSSFDMAGHVNRGRGMLDDASVHGVLNGSLPWEALVTFFLPLLAKPQAPGVPWLDAALVNCSIGLIPVVVVLVGMVTLRRWGWRYISFLGVGILFLAFAMGEDLPLRKWSYGLPAMDLFRFPTIFRMFAILFLLLAAGEVLRRPVRGRFGGWFVGAAVILVALAIYQLVAHGVGELPLWGRYGFDAFSAASGWSERMIIQATIGAGFLLAAGWAIRTGRLARALPVLIMAEIIVSTQLVAPDTMRHTRGITRQLDAVIAACPTAYPLPPLDGPLSAIHDEALRYNMPWLWRSLAMLHKLPTGLGHSPYRLLAHAEAENNGTLARLKDRPLAYWARGTGRILPSQAGADLFGFAVRTDTGGRLVLLQNRYPGWRLQVNGRPAVILGHEHTFMAVDIPPGEHLVQWKFRPFKIIVAAWVSILAWVVVATLVCIPWLRTRSPDVRLIIVVAAIVAIVVVLIWAAWQISIRMAGASPEQQWAQLVEQIDSVGSEADVHWLVNTDRSAGTYRAPDGSYARTIRTTLPSDMHDWTPVLGSGSALVAYMRSGVTRWPSENAILARHFRTLYRNEVGGTEICILERPDTVPTYPATIRSEPFPPDGLLVEGTYGPVIKMRRDQLPAGHAFVIHAEAGPVSNLGPMVVVEVVREGRSMHWDTYAFSHHGTGEMIRAAALVDLRMDLRPDDEVAFLLWHPDATPFRVRSFEVAPWPADAAWRPLVP